jgi:hypothetical protein
MVRLKIRCRKACGFESLSRHQPSLKKPHLRKPYIHLIQDISPCLIVTGLEHSKLLLPDLLVHDRKKTCGKHQESPDMASHSAVGLI